MFTEQERSEHGEYLKKITSKADMNRLKSAIRNIIFLIKKYPDVMGDENSDDENKAVIEDANELLAIIAKEEERRGWLKKPT